MFCLATLKKLERRKKSLSRKHLNFLLFAVFANQSQLFRPHTFEHVFFFFNLISIAPGLHLQNARSTLNPIFLGYTLNQAM